MASPASPPVQPTSTAAAFLRTIAGVDLWRVDLDGTDPDATEVLAPPERARAARLVFERHRRRFVAGRAALRRTLAAYLDVAPDALELREGPRGKPWVAGGPEFSFSHSEGYGLLGVTESHEIGVDLERLREIAEVDALAASALTPDERAAWAAAPGDRSAAFLRAWTRKEATLKALGVGLGGAVPPPGTPDAPSISVLDLDLLPGHAAALAIMTSARRGSAR